MSERLLIDRCPALADVLCAMEDELPSSQGAAVLAHVRRCERCRNRARDISRLTEIFADEVAPPNRLEAEMRFTEFRTRLHAHKQALIVVSARSPISRGLPLAALLLLLIVTLLTWPQDVVRADELLAQASAHARTRLADTSQLVQIRVAPEEEGAMRPVATDSALFSLGASCAAAEHSGLAALLATHHLDLRKPLSIDRFLAWRATLAQKTERVSESGMWLTLHTATTEGLLRETRLFVRRDTFQVVALDLEFEGMGRVTIQNAAERMDRAGDRRPSTREQTCSTISR